MRKSATHRIKHIPNKKTKASLIKSEQDKDAAAFESPLKMFKYLGLPTTCLKQSSQKSRAHKKSSITI